MSRVVMGCVVVIIGLIAVLVRYPPEFVRGAFQASSNSVHPDASPATVASVSNPFRTRVASSGGASVGKSDAQVVAAASIQPKEQRQFDGGHQQAEVATAQIQETDPSSVIGRPFPVSASVQETCKITGCADMVQDLSKFVQEPRDPSWSDGMEARLRNYIEAQPGNYAIRDIECRTSVCAVEVTSNSQFPYSSWTLVNHIAAETDIELGFENASSGKIVVTYIAFKRL